MLSIKVSRHLGDFHLQLEVECRYPVTAVFGPSGAGKTTLLNLVAGLLRPDAGAIRIDGETLFDDQTGIDLPPERRQVGYVFQDDLLFPHLTVRGNLRYGYERVAPARRRFELGPVVELLEIGALLERHPRELSGGERQRVALGRALLRSPQLLLMDEPLASLDQGLKSRIIPYLRRVRSELQIPILYVSHSVAEILELTGQVIVLQRGRLLAHGDFFRVAQEPEVLPLIADYGLENVLPAEVLESPADRATCRVRCCGQEWLVPQCHRPPGSRIFLGIRAEEITLCRVRPDGLPAMNAVPGQVVGVVDAGGICLVNVDVGRRLALRLTSQAVAELDLAPGQPVICLINPLAIRIGPELD